MVKYYCDYCKSYITHDNMSVRKSHLMGRNHIKFYCDYYESKAKENGIWDPNQIAYEVNLTDLNRGIPGVSALSSQKLLDMLPPPPVLMGFPNPPPSVYHLKDEYKKSIQNAI